MTSSAQLGGRSDESLLAEIADEFVQRSTRGERPEVEEYAKRYPHIGEILRSVLPALELMRFPLSNTETEAEPPDASQKRARLGDYQIIREVGRGGMGLVYEAEQISMGRRVALKVLPFAALLDPRQLARFKNEARAAGQLHHTNIVPVFSVGSERGVHYYAMQYVEGQTLAEVIRDLRQLEGLEHELADNAGQPSCKPADSLASGRFAPPNGGSQREDPTTPRNGAADAIPGAAPDSRTRRAPQTAISSQRSTKSPAYFRSISRLGIQVAEALDHAHQHGVIHRDMKPSNVILDTEGKAWVTDFGLARIETGASLTISGDLLGTVRYMSPEQALAKPIVIDHRTDIYSLGVTLYELLTLQPAFAGRDREELLRQIALEEPRAPRRLNKSVPADLETVVLKAMAKEPADRYGTALELADDLKRFLEDMPIRARRPTLWQRAAKWSRRHRAVVLSAAVSAILLLAFSVVVLAFSYVRINDALEGRTAALQRERKTLYYHRVALAQRALSANLVHRARQYLEACPPEYRHWEWHHLRWRTDRSIRTMTGHEAYVTAVAFSPDGKSIASASFDSTIRIWEMETGRTRRILRHPEKAYSVAYSPDGGRRLAAGGPEKITLWNAETGRMELEINAHQSHDRHFNSLAFSPDGRCIGSGSDGQSVKIWDAVTGELTRTLQGHTAHVNSVAFAPDGTRLVSGGEDARLILWETATGKPVLTIQEYERGAYPHGHRQGVISVAFNPDGTRLASGSWDGTIRLWDAETGDHLLTVRGHKHWIGSVAFNHDGTRLVSTCADNSCRVWDAENGEELLTLRGHLSPVVAAAFSPDDRWIVSGGWDAAVKLWDAAQREEVQTLSAHQGMVFDVAFSLDGSRIASGGEDHAVRLWDALSGAEQCTLQGHTGTVFDVAFSPSGSRIVSASGDNTIKLWDAGSGRLLRTLHGHSDPVYAVTFSPDGKRIASGGGDNTLKLWDLGQSRPLLTLHGHTKAIFDVAFSPDGRTIATASADATCRVWDADTGQPLTMFRGHSGPVVSVAFSPDGARVASSCPFNPKRQPGEIKLWSPASGAELAIRLENNRTPRTCPAFSPDGQRIVAAGHDRSLVLWDAVTGEEALVLRGHKREARCAAFSPDGTRIVSGCNDGTLKIWESEGLSSLQPVTPEEAQP